MHLQIEGLGVGNVDECSTTDVLVHKVLQGRMLLKLCSDSVNINWQ